MKCQKVLPAPGGSCAMYGTPHVFTCVRVFQLLLQLCCNSCIFVATKCMMWGERCVDSGFVCCNKKIVDLKNRANEHTGIIISTKMAGSIK